MKISVLIPAYNEENTIKEILHRVSATGLADEIIIVNDASSDKTRQILENLKADNIKIFHHNKTQGKGAAIRTALEHISGDIVIIQDADLEYDPNEYKELIKPIINGNADVVYGSRLNGGKPQRAYMFWHKLGNSFFSFLTNFIYNTTLSDIMVGYKLFRKEVIEDLKLKSNDFRFDAEITGKILKKKCRIYELPISYYGRTYAEGKKISWKHSFGVVAAIIWYRFFD